MPKVPNGAMLLNHLAQHYPDKVGVYLDQMRGSEEIGEVAAQAFELIEDAGCSFVPSPPTCN